MLSLNELIDAGLDFMDKGGPILWLIGIISFGMWLMILERYWYLNFAYPDQLSEVKKTWQLYRKGRKKFTARMRKHMLDRLQSSAQSYLNCIRLFAKALPLLGLLGTVFGMIHTFEVITVFGNGNVRGLASGISEALITTMAGLITALSGIYFSTNLFERVHSLLDQAASELN